ncbi:ComEC/Rec2 family competence protein [Rhizobium sp. CG5]|uniref:ComEC/Rec2 family competence protein n=1 Tax=Rhizobium sp. CG5 TaxID=2726076 RepID=UPI002033795D|nr:ComEC/Rec2 family competence protein [Rhizobium sp. CG5]
MTEARRAPVGMTARLERLPERSQGPGDDDDDPGPLALLSGDARSELALSPIGRLARRGAVAWDREVAFGHAFLLVPVCLGVGAVAWFTARTTPHFLAVILALAVLVPSAIYAWSRNRTLYHALAALALMATGMLLADLETARRSTVLIDTPVTTWITGRVEAREPDGAGRWRYVVKLDATRDPVLKRPPSRAALLARSAHQPLVLGQAISGRARLQPPSGPALPGLTDFAFGSYFSGIGAIGYFYGPPQAVAAPSLEQPGWLTAAETRLSMLRGNVTLRIRSVIPGDAGAFAAAIVTGERRGLSEETNEALRMAGLFHIISISGLHMALAGGLFFVGLRFLLSLSGALAEAYPIKKIAAAGALLTTTGYFLISGYQVTAQRAFLMMAIMLCAAFVDRPVISMRNAAVAAIIVIAISPSQILGPSFQMSFAATAALIAGYAAWRRRPRFDTALANLPGARLAKPVATLFGGIILTSLIGGLSTSIFALSHFHRIGAHSIEANLAAMPIMSLLVMPAGLIGMLLMPFGLDAVPLKIMGFGLDMVIAVARYVAGWGGEVATGRLSQGFLPLASAGLIVLTLLGSNLRHLGTACLVMAFAWEFLTPPARPPDIVIAEDGRLVGLLQDGVMATNRRRPPDFIYQQWQTALSIAEYVAPIPVEPKGFVPAALRPATMPSPSDPPSRERPVGAPSTSKPPSSDSIRAPPLTKADRDAALTAARAAMAEMIGKTESGRFACIDKAWCVARTASGWRIAAVEHYAYVGMACDMADLVISAQRPSFTQCRSGARLITVETLRRTGSLELVLGDPPSRTFEQRAALTLSDRPWSVHRRYDWRTDAYLDVAPPYRPRPVSDSGG